MKRQKGQIPVGPLLEKYKVYFQSVFQPTECNLGKNQLHISIYAAPCRLKKIYSMVK